MIDGLAVVDKPAGWTSHDVVARCRKIFGQRRVGHSGTLDPDATGVLLVGLGRVTRLLRYLTELPKTYTGVVVLGVATSTLDAAGEVTGEWDMSAVTLDEARLAAATLTGDILQVPPMVSAVQVGGKRLHELARAGIEVERQARPVTVHRFDVEPGPDRSTLAVDVRCSSGTYVRVLAADLGAALGGGAHLRELRRTAIGSFGVAEAVALEALGPEHLVPPVEALRDLASVDVDDAAARDVSHGKPLAGLPGGAVRVVGPDGDLLAVYEDGRPAVVLAASGQRGA
ncbi:MAG TPA: tRNA pseudouridine(55) synthase TruB [Acidimicrobiales bacterium]|nr:tRNA pseudouridine(55) synthase TruB [Acidimicrobiales bacterium]